MGTNARMLNWELNIKATIAKISTMMIRQRLYKRSVGSSRYLGWSLQYTYWHSAVTLTAHQFLQKMNHEMEELLMSLCAFKDKLPGSGLVCISLIHTGSHSLHHWNVRSLNCTFCVVRQHARFSGMWKNYRQARTEKKSWKTDLQL